MKRRRGGLDRNAMVLALVLGVVVQAVLLTGALFVYVVRGLWLLLKG